MRDLQSVLKGARGKQAQVARDCSISPTLLSLIKNGKRNLTLDVARRIAKATKCDVTLHKGEIRFRRLA